MLIKKITIDPKEYEKIEQWGLVAQYEKAKWYILAWNFVSADFKKRKPYKSEKWYFRLNQQYRAFGYVFWEELRIFHIDDHKR